VTFLAFFYMHATEDAEGAIVESVFNDTDISWHDNGGNNKFTHTKDDYLVTVFCNDDGDLMVAYREPSSSWSYSEVIAYNGLGNDLGHWRVEGIINTGNNSLVIYAGSRFSSTNYRLWAFTKFPADDWDEWNDKIVFYQLGVSFYNGEMAINDTEEICFITRRSSGHLYYRLFDFPNYSMRGSNSGVSYDTAAGTNLGVCIEANLTGKFWIMWKWTDNKYHIRDLDKVLSSVIIHSDTSYGMNTFGFLKNGACVVAGFYSYGVHQWPQYYYQTVPDGAFTARRLDALYSQAYNLNGQILLTQNSNYVYLLFYSETDEILYRWGRLYDATELQWQDSMTDTGITATDEYQVLGASNSLWPQYVSGDICWTRIKTGWAVTYADEDPTPDDHGLMNDGMEWTADLTTGDPEITTAALLDATYDVFWEQALTKTGGTTPFEWTLLIAPGWMSIGASNGTIYGTPDGTGSETVRVKLADAVPRYDEREWTLTIKSASSGDGDDEPVSTSFIYDDIGEMWMLLATTAVFVALARMWKMSTYRRDQG
jgi:hypothetical protein